MSLSEPTVPETATRADFEVVLPDVGQDLDQDEEWCEILVGGERRRIRFHDYHEIYEIPGFYERLFYDRLKCESPRVIRRLLAQVLAELGTEPGELRVLDVGAGNGIVGEELRELGAGAVYGIDIIKEAAAAAHRDRPGVYERYLVADLTNLTRDERDTLTGANLNTMTTVAALGFDDMTPHAFAVAYNLISTPGLVAFTIKEDFVAKRDLSGFSSLIRRMFDEEVIRPLVEERYRHRLSVQGEPLYYIALVAEKVSDVPQSWLS
ncbi:MAG TPA: methyltransferase domain-containing protein [Pseudonocardiaceae bacterium]|jgi:SAM-dependent methyltransferase|nr:methyltransferase domain-containing protein [Pseudonocardiaceae bacterium]